jgi:hypothetical protein
VNLDTVDNAVEAGAVEEGAIEEGAVEEGAVAGVGGAGDHEEQVVTTSVKVEKNLSRSLLELYIHRLDGLSRCSEILKTQSKETQMF